MREALGANAQSGERRREHRGRSPDVLDLTLAQTPAQHIETSEILLCAESAGGRPSWPTAAPRGNLRYSFGYELIQSVHTAILQAHTSRAAVGTMI